MLHLLLAALIVGVCATNSSVRVGAALPSDHTEQSFARFPTTTANASVYIVKLTRASVGDGRESTMLPGDYGDDDDSRTAGVHTAVAMQEFRRLRQREVLDGEKLSAAEDARLQALRQANEEACDVIDEELFAEAAAQEARLVKITGAPVAVKNTCVDAPAARLAEAGALEDHEGTSTTNDAHTDVTIHHETGSLVLAEGEEYEWRSTQSGAGTVLGGLVVCKLVVTESTEDDYAVIAVGTDPADARGKCAFHPSQPPSSPSPPPPSLSPPPLSPPREIPHGCTTSTALKYRVFAVIDDGSCIQGGCMDRRIDAFAPFATFGDRSPPVLLGCMKPDASNYRTLATLEDGSCHYQGCTDPTAINHDPSATLPGECIAIVLGCLDSLALNFYNTASGKCTTMAANDECSIYVITGCMAPDKDNRPLNQRVDRPPQPPPPPQPKPPCAAPVDFALVGGVAFQPHWVPFILALTRLGPKPTRKTIVGVQKMVMVMISPLNDKNDPFVSWRYGRVASHYRGDPIAYAKDMVRRSTAPVTSYLSPPARFQPPLPSP